MAHICAGRKRDWIQITFQLSWAAVGSTCLACGRLSGCSTELGSCWCQAIVSSCTLASSWPPIDMKIYIIHAVAIANAVIQVTVQLLGKSLTFYDWSWGKCRKRFFWFKMVIWFFFTMDMLPGTAGWASQTGQRESLDETESLDRDSEHIRWMNVIQSGK